MLEKHIFSIRNINSKPLFREIFGTCFAELVMRTSIVRAKVSQLLVSAESHAKRHSVIFITVVYLILFILKSLRLPGY